MKKLLKNVNMRGRTLVNNYKQKPFEENKRKRREFSELINIYKNSTENAKFNNEILKTFPLKSERRPNICYHHCYSTLS